MPKLSGLSCMLNRCRWFKGNPDDSCPNIEFEYCKFFSFKMGTILSLDLLLPA